jgi:hypothetical protein
MKKTGLIIFCFLAASYPATAKVLRHHHHDRHLHRHARSGERHDYTGVTPQMRAHITCDMVRAYVAQVGVEQARAVARAAGMTGSEERQARRCIESRV